MFSLKNGYTVPRSKENLQAKAWKKGSKLQKMPVIN